MAIKPLNIVILGGGVAGIATALALTKFAPKGAVPNITLYEVRKEPGVIGGAVNLTPNALRLLDYMGVYQIMKDRQYGIAVDQLQIFDVHTGKQLAETSFRGPNNEGLGTPPYKVCKPIPPISGALLLISIVIPGSPSNTWRVVEGNVGSPGQ